MNAPGIPSQQDVENALGRIPAEHRLRAAIGLICGWNTPRCDPAQYDPEHEVLTASSPTGTHGDNVVPAYEMYLDDLYQDLVPIMAEHGLWLDLRGPHKGMHPGQFSAVWSTYVRPDNTGFEMDPSPARAICLAALKALGLSIENIK